MCMTFDDGYRDTRQWAYPILQRYEVPFALYIPTSFPDRIGELWWLALEAVVARNERVTLLIDGKERGFECTSIAEKRHLFDQLYGWVRSFKTEKELREVVRDLCGRYQVDIAAFCQELCMDWDELAALSEDPLVTIGAHTVNHVMLAKVPEKSARAEMDMSRAVIEASLGVRPEHLSYPVGDATSAGPREFRIAAELGYKTAVTTRPGVLFPVASRASRPHCRAFRSTANISRCAMCGCSSRAQRRRCGTGFAAWMRRERTTADGRTDDRSSDGKSDQG